MRRIFYNVDDGISGKLYTLDDMKRFFDEDNYYCDTFEEYVEKLLNEDIKTFKAYYIDRSLHILDEIDYYINEDNNAPDSKAIKAYLEEWDLLRKMDIASVYPKGYTDADVQELVNEYNQKYL